MRSKKKHDSVLATFASRHSGIPETILHEGRRSLVNIFATAFAGSGEELVETMLNTALPFSSGTDCTLIGRTERVDLPLAASLNTASANIFDFDDTHEATILHPAAVVFSALFAHAEMYGASGRDLLEAFVIGCEVECRIGNAVSPYHYAHGWHITSTCGIFGAAAASGRLMGLTPPQMIDAFSCAASQSAGLVEMLGTGAKSVSMGNAARSGYMSAALAARGCGGTEQPLTARLGFLNVYADNPAPECLTENLGAFWEFGTNTYKPYPVGIVLNPVLEGILNLRKDAGLRLEQIARVDLIGHPLLQERTNRPDAKTGRAGQVSAQHAIAIALMTGKAGLEEFSDEAAQRTLNRGRPDVTFIDEPGRDIASARLDVHLANGNYLTREISCAAGSRRNPMSDAQLETKLTDAISLAGSTCNRRVLLDALWSIDSASDAGSVIRMTGG